MQLCSSRASIPILLHGSVQPRLDATVDIILLHVPTEPLCSSLRRACCHTSVYVCIVWTRQYTVQSYQSVHTARLLEEFRSRPTSTRRSSRGEETNKKRPGLIWSCDETLGTAGTIHPSNPCPCLLSSNILHKWISGSDGIVESNNFRCFLPTYFFLYFW